MKPSTQLLRCFGVPILRGKPKPMKETGGITASVEANDGLSIALKEASAWPTTYFDTETSVCVHSGQHFRFGYFQDRRPSYDECAEEWSNHGRLDQEFLDQLWRDGVFYDPKSPDISKADVVTLQAYAKRVNDEREAKAVEDYNKALGEAQSRLAELNKVAAGRNDGDDEPLVLDRVSEYDDGSELEQLEFEIEFMESRDPERPPKFLCLEIDEFIDKVFYHRKFKKFADNTREDHLIVAHHLPFDVGAVSSHSSGAIEELFGGVSMRLCRCDLEKYYQTQLARFYLKHQEYLWWKNAAPSTIMAEPSVSHAMIPWVKHAAPRKPYPQNQCRFHPNIIVMKLGHGKHIYDANMVRQGGKVFPSHLRFGDGMQARAFLGPVAGGVGLGNLGEVLGVATKKAEISLKELAGPITFKSIDYCRADVQSTFEVWRKVCDLNRQHGRTKPIDMEYSEASLGKAYFADFGVLPFLEKNPLRAPSPELTWNPYKRCFAPSKLKDRALAKAIQQGRFDPHVIGAYIATLYGGRSEVRIRWKIVEAILADFKSQYPTVNALMAIQELLLAEKIEVRRGESASTQEAERLAKQGRGSAKPRYDDPEARRYLEDTSVEDLLKDLQKPETWKRWLRCIALVKPEDGDVLPFRTEYQSHEEVVEGEPDIGDVPVLSVNVGLNHIVDAGETYYTYADLIASKLITGRCPTILKTMELLPIGRQATNKIKLFDQDDAIIDMDKDDLFTRIIELRADYQARAKARAKEFGKDDAEYKRLDAIQTGLKILANAASYGILIEVVADERKAERSTMVYFGDDAEQIKVNKPGVTGGYKLETPGKFFAPFGTLIPAAGRLLLAIAEKLAKDRGVGFVFCDTDSMCFARPDDMERETFREKVKEVTNWFQKLTPYRNKDGTSSDEPLFALEDVNYKLDDNKKGTVSKDEFEPLYCLGISAKRYALFNMKDDQIILRKVSSHGLGDLNISHVYKPDEHNAEHVAAPYNELKKTRSYGSIAKSPIARFVCDLWRIAVEEFRNDPVKASEKIDRIVETLPGLKEPHMVQKSLSSSHELNIYKNLPNKRGFQFFMALPPPVGSTFSFDGGNDVDGKGVRLDIRRELMKTTLYASVDPSLTSAEQIEEWRRSGEGIYRHDNSEFPWQLFDPAWDLNFKTIEERLNGNGGYFNRLEAKSRGETEAAFTARAEAARTVGLPEPRRRGMFGLLERKRVVSLEQVFIGKETHPLADVDTDEPTDETMDDGVFSASRFVIDGRKLNWSAIEPHGDAISKVLGERVGERGGNVNKDNLRKLYGVFNVDEDGVTSIKAARKKKVVQTDAWWKTITSLRNCGKYDEVARYYECEVGEVNKFDALDHRHEYGEGPTLDPTQLMAAIKLANKDQKAEMKVEKARASVASRTHRRAVDAALTPQREAMESVDRALAASPGWGVDPPPGVRGFGAMGRGETVAQFAKNQSKNRRSKNRLVISGAAVDFGSAVQPIGQDWQDPMLEFLLDQQAPVADTKAKTKTVEQAVVDWERAAKTGAPHRTMFEVAEVIVAAGEIEAAVAKVKVNERQRKCRQIGGLRAGRTRKAA